MAERKKEGKSSVVIKIAKILYTLLFVAIAAGILLIVMETFIRGDFLEAKKWMEEHYNPFILNYLIFIVFFLLFLGLFNDLLFSTFAFSLFILLLSFINRYKYMFLGENLYPWDILLYQQMFNLFPELIKEVDQQKLILASITFVVIMAALIFIKKKITFAVFRLDLLKRLVLIVLSVGLIISFFAFRSTPLKHLFQTLQITHINWNQDSNYRINGFMLSFVLNTESTIVFPPQGYGKANILQTVGDLEERLPQEKPVNQLEQKPNIIFIMNESFWDPTQLQSVTFSKDPMPTVRQNQIGWLLSPQFGGGTANIEFEALTGFSVSFLPTGSIAYQQFIGRPTPSLATVLTKQGYEATAIHPYYDWFWNRKNVYKHIGFHKFVSLDDFEKNKAEYRGPYIADLEVTKEIIKTTEATEKPDFIYAVTMQNHGPYEKGRYGNVRVNIESSQLSEEARGSLETFTQGVYDADQALAELMEYYEKSEEPTIIVFYGDHLPFLGADYLTYKEAGFVDGEWSLDEYRKMRTTPLVVWNNFSEDIPSLPETISPSFLAPYVLDLAGIEKPLYYRFLEEFSHQMPGFTTSVKSDGSGELHKSTPENVKPLEDTYLRLQYDLLFGKQYSMDALFEGMKLE
ncbi:LTA synthase family protein [Calidifontibacillus erzurumensis]|uniref:LTA synthase family protein n=1 Tax=Calidifontibacillus erzurumensis TaxID=2741433 RepID=UPI0035B52A87